jgi:hypothetical protein
MAFYCFSYLEVGQRKVAIFRGFFMRFLKRVARDFAVLLIVPLVGIEQSEQERALKKGPVAWKNSIFNK